MKDSIRAKLQNLSERLTEVNALLAEPDVIRDQEQFRALSKEHAQLNPVVDCFNQYQAVDRELEAAEEMLRDSDPELRGLAEEEVRHTREKSERLEHQLEVLLLPQDPHDTSNIFLEIRAGTGGDEAALFAGDLFRMYSRYAERRRWNIEIMSAHEGEHGGFKEIILRILGRGVYSRLKFESGAHRVQRVPTTESQGRIHTSACTVAVLPEIEDIEEVQINPSELRVDTYRASGAGGQHVNKTDSAIRLTHLPTGIVVECQDERSQHKNRARAMALLQARLVAIQRERQEAEQAQSRRLQVGSGDRSERIRTYNFPQGRVTDHRIGLTLYKLEEILEGALDQVINPLISEHHAEQLAEIAQ